MKTIWVISPPEKLLNFLISGSIILDVEINGQIVGGNKMTQIEALKVNGKTAQGIRIVAPGGEGHPNMIVLTCDKGYVMCGYLNAEAAGKFGDAAAIVGGATFDEILANPVKAVTEAAAALGIKEGMTGAEAVELLSE